MKRSTSPITRTHPAARAAAAFAVVLAALLFVYAPLASPASAQESTGQMPAGMEVGDDGVSINDGEIFAGDGCAKVGELEAGDCAGGKAGGKAGGEDANGPTGEGDRGAGSDDGEAAEDDAADEAGRVPSDEQYGAEGGSGADEATVLESTTSGGSGPEGGESTQSQIIESTTGVVEEGSGADAEADPGAAGGEPRPESATEEGTTGEGTTGEAAPEEAASEEGAAGAEDADRTCAVEGPVGETTTTTVEEAVDGDTVETPEGTVRLIGVDTPETVDPGEPVEPGGKKASEFTTDALEGDEVELEFGEEPKDDYGRALAYLWVEDGSGEPVMFNETLLREGLGELLIIPPNDEYEACLAAAEKRAKAEGVGMWAEGGAEDGADEEPVPHETTGGATATEDADADATPPADDEGGREGLLSGIFGGEEPSGTTEDQYAGETTASASPPETDEPETTAPAPPPETEDPPAVEGQYDDGGASAPEPGADTDEAEAREPEIQEEEIQDPEVQEKGVQEKGVQEKGAQEPEAQDPPARSNELAASTPPPVEDEAPAADAEEVPVRASAELPPDETSAPPSSAPAAPAAAAAITTLPETGGASVLAPAAGALLVCSGLVAARLARRPGRDTADGR